MIHTVTPDILTQACLVFLSQGYADVLPFIAIDVECGMCNGYILETSSFIHQEGDTSCTFHVYYTEQLTQGSHFKKWVSSGVEFKFEPTTLCSIMHLLN